MAVTSHTSRKARYRENRKAEGLVQVSAWIPENLAGDFYLAADMLRNRRNLEWGPLRDKGSGRLVSYARASGRVE